ncbi:MAG: hypothetical protein ABI315_05850 [Bacteroidia bacterium]
MKKLFLILPLLFFYLSMSSGIRVNVHFCGGKIKNISFFDLKEKESCCGSKMKSKGCCHNKTTFIKINDTHQSAFLIKAPLSSFKIIDHNIPVFTLNYLLNYHILYSVSNFQKPPPLLVNSTLYLSNRVLLI